jgi:hypothetical protein
MVGLVLITAGGQLADRLDGCSRVADASLIEPVERVQWLACIENLGRRLQPALSRDDLYFVLNTQPLSLSGPGGEVSLRHGQGQLLAAGLMLARSAHPLWKPRPRGDGPLIKSGAGSAALLRRTVSPKRQRCGSLCPILSRS